jgi:hypothetical protein
MRKGEPALPSDQPDRIEIPEVARAGARKPLAAAIWINVALVVEAERDD